MERNPLAEVGDRLGWFAYLTVMGGGLPYWPALFVNPRKALDEMTTSDDEPGNGGHGQLADTVPYEYRPDRHSPIAA